MFRRDSQQLQRPRNLVDHTRWSRTNAQDCMTPTCNLRPARIRNDFRDKTKTDSRSLECIKIFFAFSLQSNLHLSTSLPPAQNFRFWIVLEEVLIAC